MHPVRKKAQSQIETQEDSLNGKAEVTEAVDSEQLIKDQTVRKVTNGG